MGAIQPWHIILVVVVFVVLFGSKKLPDAARGLGRSMRIFKSEVKEMQHEGSKDSADTAAPTEAPRQIPAASDATPPVVDHETERKSA